MLLLNLLFWACTERKKVQWRMAKSSNPSQMDTIFGLQTLKPTSLRSPYAAFSIANCSPKKHKQKQLLRQRRQIPKLPFPKSSPTPVIISSRPSSYTKLQALESVINELESSIKKRIKIDIEIFASILETCFQLGAFDYGIRIHRLIPDNLLRRNVGLSSKLLRLYTASGRIDEAHRVFDNMSDKDSYAFPWNSLISGYVGLGSYEDALALYFQMEEEGVAPDEFTFPRVLKACARVGLMHVGQEVHRNIIRHGFGNDVFVLNGLVDMYAKCGDVVKARKLFDMIMLKDLVSWNSMLTGYIRHELLGNALSIFRRMVQNGHEPDSITISTILASGLSLKLAAQIHGWVLRRGIEWNLSVANSLVVVYSKNGQLDGARWVFDKMPERDLISWNSIISAHCKHPQALLYFRQMEDYNTLPDAITFVSLLSTSAHLGMVKDGERLFSLMTEKYGVSPIMEHYACMVNLYGRAGLINKAYGIIMDRMEFEAGPTVWGALLYACYHHNNVEIGEKAAEKLFDLEPDNEHNFELLMEIYGKSGHLEDVERVRGMMLDRGFDL